MDIKQLIAQVPDWQGLGPEGPKYKEAVLETWTDYVPLAHSGVLADQKLFSQETTTTSYYKTNTVDKQTTDQYAAIGFQVRHNCVNVADADAQQFRLEMEAGIQMKRNNKEYQKIPLYECVPHKSGLDGATQALLDKSTDWYTLSSPFALPAGDCSINFLAPYTWTAAASGGIAYTKFNQSGTHTGFVIVVSMKVLRLRY